MLNLLLFSGLISTYLRKISKFCWYQELAAANGACNPARLVWLASTMPETPPASPGLRGAILFLTGALVSTVFAAQPAPLGRRVATLYRTNAP